MNLEYNPKKPLISFHIPKCGGTTLGSYLKNWFKKGYHAHYYDEKKCQKPAKADLNMNKNIGIFKL